MSIGANIKKYRKEKGYTQKELAGLIGVSVQAISKWETDSGAPDISQVVPLAKALEISTDILFDYRCENDAWVEMEEISRNHSLINIFRNRGCSEEEYKKIAPYFSDHAQNTDAAAWCLKCLVDLIVAGKMADKDKKELQIECEKYANCIFRYETDIDKIFMANLVLSRAYYALGEYEKSQTYLEKIPITFGDRLYWEAEIAQANKEYEIAMQKCRESFTTKARYLLRCIRMACEITREDTELRWNKMIEYSEYMVRILDAFLSGGDYLPARQIMQKCGSLSTLFEAYAHLKKWDEALENMEKLFICRAQYREFLKCSEEKQTLLFSQQDTVEYQMEVLVTLDEGIEETVYKLKEIPELMEQEKTRELLNKYHLL